MPTNVDRRGFLKTAAAAATGVCLARRSGRQLLAAPAAQRATPNAEKLGWLLACQLYTFRRFPFYEALDKIASLGVKYLEPCFFLPLDKSRPELKTGEQLSAAHRKELKRKLAEHGMEMINYYAQIAGDEAAARKAFEFAQEMDVRTIVSEPPAEAFDLVEKLCDEYEIDLAVHNHPKSPTSKYWRPENVLEVCRGRSKRIGACCDTGHWVRSALDPVECLEKMEGRIITMHLKDVGEWGKPEARDVPLGTGRADYAAVLRELKRQGFKGVLAIEYEHDSPELMDEVAECIAFVEKTAQTL
ncbi:MAG: sugar phosphate isomerase/epimerase family protein [Planctomycetota bacterium]|jgi:sugar phosphate isomerase/epimerase